MTINSGVSTRISYKAYASGVIADPLVAASPGATGGQILRRVSSSLNLGRASFQSQEINSHRQIEDYRLGSKSVAGEIAGELSPSTYWDFIEAICRQAEVAEISKSNTEFTSVAATASTSKFTVGASTWAAQGFRVGDVIRFSSLSVAGNNDVNYLIYSLSGVDAFVTPAPTDMGADTAFTVLRKGKKVMIPTSSHTSTLFAIEHYFQDIDAHELFQECRIGSMRLDAPANGMATCSFGFLGRDMASDTAGSSPYLSGPTAATTTGLLAGPNGKLVISGAVAGTLTSFGMTFDLSPSSVPVIGSLLVPEIHLGRSNIGVTFSAMLDGFTRITEFVNETDVALSLLLEAAGSAPKAFVSLNLPKLRITRADVQNSGEEGTIIQCTAQALKRASATGFDETSISFQDSEA